MAERSKLLQYWAALCANILTFSCGLFAVWPTSCIPLFKSDDSPLETGPLSASAEGWIISMLALGGGLGPMLASIMSKMYGPKMTLLISAVPLFLSWFVLPFAAHPIYLVISRFLGGFTSGVVFYIIPQYISDIADINLRGILGTFLTFSYNIGNEVSFILSYYFHYNTMAWLNVPIPLLFLVLFAFLPDSPRFLMQKNKTEKAEDSFRYFRNLRAYSKELTGSYQAELEKLKVENNHQDESQAVSWKDFCEPKARKAFLISIVLLAFNVLCGIFALLNNATTIFHKAGSNMDPKLASICVGAIIILGSCVATFFVERAGRKLLMCISCAGSALGEAVLGGYVYASSLGYDTKPYAWISLASFCFIVFVGTIGLLSVPYVIVAELLPPQIRETAMMIGMSSVWVMSWSILKSIPFLDAAWGLHGVMFMFCGFCTAGFIFCLILLPETKGRTNEEILALL